MKKKDSLHQLKELIQKHKGRVMIGECWRPRLKLKTLKGNGRYKLRVKCGDCPEQIDIYFDLSSPTIEIGGVLTTIEEWHLIFNAIFNLFKSPPHVTRKKSF